MRHVLIVLNHRKHESSLLVFSLVLRSKSSGHSNSPFSPLLFFRHPTPPSPSSLPPNSPPPLVKHEFSLLHGGRKGATILNNSLTAIVPHSVNVDSSTLILSPSVNSPKSELVKASASSFCSRGNQFNVRRACLFLNSSVSSIKSKRLGNFVVSIFDTM